MKKNLMFLLVCSNVFIFANIGSGELGGSITEANQAALGDNTALLQESESYFYNFTILDSFYYKFTLVGPTDTDFDIEIYDSSFTSIGQSFEPVYPEIIEFNKINGSIIIEIFSFVGSGEFNLQIEQVEDPDKIVYLEYSDFLGVGDKFTWNIVKFSGNTSLYSFTNEKQIEMLITKNLKEFIIGDELSNYFFLTFNGTNNIFNDFDLFVQPIWLKDVVGQWGVMSQYLKENNSFFKPFADQSFDVTVGQLSNGMFFVDIYNNQLISITATYDPHVGILDELYYDFFENGTVIAQAQLRLSITSDPYIESLNYLSSLTIGESLYWGVSELKITSGYSLDVNEDSVYELQTLTNEISNVLYKDRFFPFRLILDSQEINQDKRFFIIPTSITYRDGSTGDAIDYLTKFNQYRFFDPEASVSIWSNVTHVGVEANLKDNQIKITYAAETGLMVYANFSISEGDFNAYYIIKPGTLEEVSTSNPFPIGNSDLTSTSSLLTSSPGQQDGDESGLSILPFGLVSTSFLIIIALRKSKRK